MALTVFELVAEHQPIGVSDVARRLGAGKSTVQRCLKTLQDAGWIRPESDGATKWVISARLLSLCNRTPAGDLVRKIAMPVMQQLREETQETVHLAIPEERDSVLIERFESQQPVRISYALGSRVPLHASATGKSILARMPPAKIADYAALPLEQRTRRTISTAAALHAELAEIRERGWSETHDELGEGSSAVAAAIVDIRGEAVAALSVSGPSSRFSYAVRLRHARAVMAAAEQISQLMSG